MVAFLKRYKRNKKLLYLEKEFLNILCADVGSFLGSGS